MANESQNLDTLINDADELFSPSAYLNKAGTKASPIINVRGAYRGVTPQTIALILKNPQKAAAAAFAAVRKANDPAMVAELKAKKVAKKSPAGQSADDQLKAELEALANG